MSCVLYGVFLPEQYGNRSARNTMHPFSHTQSRALHLSRSFYMQNKLMSAYPIGFQYGSCAPSQSPDVWTTDNWRRPSRSRRYQMLHKCSIHPRMALKHSAPNSITSIGNPAYHVLIPLFPSTPSLPPSPSQPRTSASAGSIPACT